MSLITNKQYIHPINSEMQFATSREFRDFIIEKNPCNFNLFGNLEDMRAWSSDEVGSLKCGRALLCVGHMQRFHLALKSWMTLGKCFNLSVLQFLLLELRMLRVVMI